VKTANPATVDSTPDHHPGTTGYFMKDTIAPGLGGCWEYPRALLGYDCVGGIGFRFYLTLIDRVTGEQLQAEVLQAGSNGLPEQRILGTPTSRCSATSTCRPHAIRPATAPASQRTSRSRASVGRSRAPSDLLLRRLANG
jgi:hypothetical protein